MNTSTSKKTVLYTLLLGVSAMFLFPFYWVLISSVKTSEGLSMSPPSLYPSEYQKADVVMSAAERVVEIDGETWFRMVNAPDLIAMSEGDDRPGAYYVQIVDGIPTQLTRWWPDSVTTPLAVAVQNDEIAFRQVQIARLTELQRDVAVAARMVRPMEDGVGELLFVASVSGEQTGDLEVLRNVAYENLRGWKMRLKNYPETLEGPEASFGERSTGFLTFLRNSFFISIMAVIGQIFSSSLVAYAFARLQFKGREILFVVLLATMMIPGQVTLVPLFSIYKSLGWIDSFLPLIVPHFMAGAFNVFLMRQYMLTLPKELDESATIDGCGPLRTYFYVILPNCIPVLTVVGLFTFVGTWQDVLGPLIYLDNPDYRTVTLGLEYFRSPYVDNRHLLMTGAVLAMLPVAILFLFFQRYIMSGVATSGLKS